MPKYIDLTNQTFGRWKVLYHDDELSRPREHRWICQCSCKDKTIKSVLGRTLRSGKSKSCGCITKENLANSKIHTKPNTEDIVGKTFGKTTVIQKVESASDGRAQYLCLCSCGNYHISPAVNLRKGKTLSCGCLSKEQSSKKNSLDLTNQRFGRLIARKVIGSLNNCNVWLCECDCGNTCEVTTVRLNKGYTQSCGCLKSKGNSKIEQILKEFNILYQKEVTFSNLVNPETNAFLRYDFGIFSKEGKIDYLIEYDGIQHFLTEGSGFYSKEILENMKKHDAIKTEFCLTNHIPLIRIPYTHFQELSIQDLLIESSSFCVPQATLL